jgi:hypothetical protein
LNMPHKYCYFYGLSLKSLFLIISKLNPRYLNCMTCSIVDNDFCF